MLHVDDMIMQAINTEYKTVRQLSDELGLPYVRVSVRIKKMRKLGTVIYTISDIPHRDGVKPFKYKKKNTDSISTR